MKLHQIDLIFHVFSEHFFPHPISYDLSYFNNIALGNGLAIESVKAQFYATKYLQILFDIRFENHKDFR